MSDGIGIGAILPPLPRMAIRRGQSRQACHPSPDKFAGFRIPAEILDRVDVVCERALFVIDRNGVIFWSYRSPIAVNTRRRRHP